MLLSRWAAKFLLMRIFIDFISNARKVFTIAFSMVLYKLRDIRDQPKIIPTRRRKNISNKSARFSVMIDNGSRK